VTPCAKKRDVCLPCQDARKRNGNSALSDKMALDKPGNADMIAPD